MNDSKQPILFLNPVFKQMVWGGDRLETEWRYQIPSKNVGECWAVSARPGGDCTIRDGIYAGYTLSSLWEQKPELFGNTGLDRFPLLVKILDAKTDLSIQVHPDDAYAAVHENGSLGKSECWYVLDCPENAKLVFGHNAQDRAELIDMVRNGRWKEFIREITVKKGDVIQNAPGTIHAITGGMLLLEVQQNSDITYRVYDYDRLVDGKLRPLHIKECIDVTTVPAQPLEECLFHTNHMPVNTRNLLIACDYYKIWKLDVTKSLTMEQDEPFMVMSVVAGEGLINGQKIGKGDHFILPAEFGSVHIEGNILIIASSCP
ncbi:MAG: class I mannose-6-phosphate isomerase [Muribaculaceae bacterium]|nr:class I mannose-6-phosphate isomerase [Muribaculaceae bacterium]